MQPDPRFHICNVVASFKLDRRMDLGTIHQAYKEISIWDDRIFRRLVLILRLPSPKMSLLIYETGKVICSGALTVADALKSDTMLVDMLSQKHIHAAVLEPAVVHNIVAVASYHRDVDLETLAYSLEGVEYEPEQFPGAVVKLAGCETPGNASFLVFPTGKVVCLGCRSEEQIVTSLKTLFSQLDRVLGP